MNEFEINVDIKQNKLVAPVIELVQNDYNSTKFNFNFTGDNNYTKVLQLQFPDGSTLIKNIINNEVVLAEEKEGQIVPVLIQSGKYIFDVVVYSNNAKLTTTNQGTFFVRSEITAENVELDDRLPILDRLITETNNLDIQVSKVNNITTLQIIKKDGTVETVEVKDGEKGDKGDTGTIDYNQLENKPDLSNVATTEYVDQKLAEEIENAIGGAY